MGLYSCGNTEIWNYTAVEHRDVGIYSCVKTELSDYTAVGTKLIVTPHLQFTQLQLVLVTTLTPTSSAGPTKLIVTPHLQFTQLHLVLVTTLTPTSSAGTKLIDSYPTLALHTAEAG